MGQVELDHRDVQCTLQVRNTMIDQIVLDKENVPPQPTSNTRQPCQVINRVPIANIGGSHGDHWKGDTFFEKGKSILEHIIQFFFQPFEWENKKQENGAYKFVNRGRTCVNSCMDSRNAWMWILNTITTIKDKSCRTHPNNTNTIQARSPQENLVVLV